jgi:replicative DNA helicase
MNNDNKQIPFDEKIERTVIGCFLIDSNASIEYSSQLLPDMFFTEQCKSSLIAIRNLINEGIEVDMLSVFKESSKLKNGVDANFLNNCMSSINNTSNLAFYVASLKEFHVRRVLYSFSLKVSQNALNLKSDPLQLIGEVQRNLTEAVDSLVVKPVDELKVLVKERLHELTTAKKEDLKIKGVPTGLVSIDEMFNGRMQNGALIILAGRPSQGKSTLALNILRNASLFENSSVAVFSLEMSKQQLTNKFISTESDINSKDIDKGFVYDSDKQALIEASGRLYDSKIFIDDSSYLTPMILRSKATNLKVKHNIKLIVVDYLQLMSGDDKKGKNREQEISEISRSLKILAKDLDLPIIALSQLSRACETRTDKRPMLSDLRESGSIEQDADNVLFVFRPEYYKFENFEDGSSTHNKAEIIFGKNRGGEVGTKIIDCDLSKSKFYDLSQKTVYNSIKEVNYKLPQNIISEEFDMPF